MNDRKASSNGVREPLAADDQDATRDNSNDNNNGHSNAGRNDNSNVGADVPGADPAGAAAGAEALDDVPAVELVRRISNGDLDIDALSPDARRRCVDHLSLEGYSTGDIACLLHLPERSVRRDRAALRREDALQPTLTLADELLGELQRATNASITRLARLSNDPSVPPATRLRAEEAVTRVHARFIDTARKLGYLRTGQSRLDHLTQTDPETQRREREARQAVMDKIFRPDSLIDAVATAPDSAITEALATVRRILHPPER